MLNNFAPWCLVRIVAIGFVCSLVSCSSDNGVAGGVSEETNTVAVSGQLLDTDGAPVAYARVVAKHATIDSISYADSTDKEGFFALPIVEQGVYGISATKVQEKDTLSLYQTIKYEGEKQEIQANLKPSYRFEGNFEFDKDGSVDKVVVSLPGSDWKTETDANGHFVLEAIPEGVYPVTAVSPDPSRYMSGIYILSVSKDKKTIVGPIPSNRPTDRKKYEDKLAHPDENRTVRLPTSYENGLVGYWTMDMLQKTNNPSLNVTFDVTGNSDPIILHGIDEMRPGKYEKALYLDNANTFGVVERDRGVLDSATEMTLELNMKMVNLGERESYRKNIIGKYGLGIPEQQDVFSFAVISNECGVVEPRLAFFIADGSGDSLSCDNVVISKTPIEMDKWIYYAIVWDGGKLSLYKNGNLDGSVDVSVEVLQPSPVPIFFGKDDVKVFLDDVRLSTKAIAPSDALYRSFRKEGAK
ncbi:MAG: hypothetical protein HUK20_10710 [Fibrobacter sp.]|nr:hypothetical protein [Fibrobacter sp.]